MTDKEDKTKDQLTSTGSGEQEEGIILNDDLSDEEVEKGKSEVKEELKKEESKDEKKEDSKKDSKEEIEDKEELKDEKKKIEDPTPSKDEDDEGPPPPPKPTRPLSTRQEAKKNLKEAFPTVEDSTIEAILIASSFKLEPAFNALLYLSDPSSIKFDEVPVMDEAPTPRRQLTQLEQDEMLAKRLDEEYNKNQRRERRRRHHQQQGEQGQNPGDISQQQTRQRRTGVEDSDDDDVFSNFVEKDLPQIKEQFSKNLEETKSKFNNWVSGWKKQYQTTSEEWQQKNRQSSRGQQQQQSGGGGAGRRRYEFEEDPEEFDVREFHGISLGNNDDADNGEEKPKLPNRNRSESTDLYGTPKHGKSTSGQKKWEPLQTKKPDPISTTAQKEEDEVDDDFLLSDDELVGSKK